MEDLLDDIIVEPKLASIGTRIGAASIDWAVIWVIAFAMGSIWGVKTSDPATYGFSLTGAPAFYCFLICFLVIVLPEGLTGKTLGQRLLKIKVVRKDYSGPSLGRSILRHLFDFFEFFFLVGIIVAASTERRQRIGDLVAGTVVVVG
jgi:uncharacterized RDD family membrane protein YckC